MGLSRPGSCLFSAVLDRGLAYDICDIETGGKGRLDWVAMLDWESAYRYGY